MNKILFSLLLFVLVICNLQAQTTKMGTPKSWALKTNTLGDVPVHSMPAFDLEAQLRTDAINEANKVGPWRFGYEHQVNMGLNNSGHWMTMPNGDRIWRIIFRSADALSMNILFDQFRLPQGATMYIYDENRTQFEGAYTAANNNSDAMLGTSLIEGSNIVVEYYEPAAVAGQGQLNIGTVIHGYKSLNLYASGLLKALNSSDKCNLDVKCPLGNGWEDQINSVAIIIVGGSGACTGTLVNNTSNDGTPYFLSARHCGTTGLGNWVFRFNWDSPVAVCSQNLTSQDPGAPYNQVNGATLRANSGGSDFCLMQLNTTPTGNIYYAGWSRSATAATQVTCIHHPSGDVKKISRENQAVTASSSFGGAQTWQVANWDQGTTEPGSSGSPLFDQNQRIIGQLYGGTAACSGLINNGDPDYFGRFDISWVGGGSNSTRLSNWLDPTGTGATTLDGYNPNANNVTFDAGLSEVLNMNGTFCDETNFIPVIVLHNYDTSTMISATITYNLDGAANSTFNWSGSLASGSSDTVSLPSVSISTGGAHSFNATVTAPNGLVDANGLNNVARSSFFAMLNTQNAGLVLRTDCWGTETSWEILSGTSVIYSSPSYSNGNPTIYNSTLCLGVGCYTFSISDVFGDGMSGAQYTTCGQDGYYNIIDPNGDTVVAMAAANFGANTTHNFCISAPSSIENAVSQVNNVQIFPNPNNGRFTVALSLGQSMTAELQVYNAMGQLLQTKEQNGANFYNYNLDLSAEAAGLYFVKIVVGNEVITRKVVKQ